jgi:Reverse transcriptase (RNA-dependent DNA polymerase)
MEAVRIAFKILHGEDAVLPGYQYMERHMVFEIKIKGFRHKARLVAGGHMTETPAVMTYVTMVSRDMVRIALTIAALNDLEAKTSNIKNAYLTAPCKEKIYTTLGQEFGPNAGKKAIIIHALYGLKNAGASFGHHISDCMQMLGYERCKADPDLWYKPMVCPDDKFECYVYVLLFVDDCLAIHHNEKSALTEIDKYFPMKLGSIGDPDMYLGAKLKAVQMQNNVLAWGMSSSKYVQEAVRNAELYLAENFGGCKFVKRARGPWPTDYVSELDMMPKLSPKLVTSYQSQSGVLHWIVELGWVNIIMEVLLLASAMAMPREGHLDAVFHVFAYLKGKHNARLVFDLTYLEIDEASFPEHDWKNTYGDVQEAVPLDMPQS